jgi:uncharacterized protein DUF6256
MSSLVIRQSLVPMIVFYLVIMATLATGLRMSRRAARRRGTGQDPATGDTARGADPGEQPSGGFAAAAAPATAGRDRPGARAANAPAPAVAGRPAGGASAAGRERPGGRLPIRPGPGWQRLIVHYASTAGGGYLLLMTVVVIYYFGVARVGGNFILSAFSGCALLIGLSTPVFFLATWLTVRRR